MGGDNLPLPFTFRRIIMSKFYHLNILDKSPSMRSVKKETIDGYNKQIQAMKKSAEDHPEQEHIASLVLFDSWISFDTWIKPASEAKLLTMDTYKLGSGTALHDGIGTAVMSLKNEIVIDLKDPNTKVFVTIFTDGEENSSKEFTAKDCLDIIKKLGKTEQWTFAFMGCSENTLEQAKEIGISISNTVIYREGTKGTQEAFTRLASARSCLSDSVSNGTYATQSLNVFSNDEEEK